MPLLFTSCVLLSFTAAAAAPPMGWMAGAQVGAAYDANIDGSEDLAEARGAASWTAGASIGAWVAPGRARLLLGLNYDTGQLPAYPDLSSNAVFGSLALRIPVAWHVDLTVGPFLGARWLPETARSSWDLGGSSSLGWLARPWLRADIGYRYVHRAALDDVYDRDAHRGLVGLEFRLARHTFLVVSGTVERGESVFYDTGNVDVNAYVDVYAVKAGAGKEGKGDSGSGSAPEEAPQTSTDGLGTEMIAWSAPAWSTTVELGVEQDLGRMVTLAARVGFMDVRAEPAAWQSLYGSLGVRLRVP